MSPGPRLKNHQRNLEPGAEEGRRGPLLDVLLGGSLDRAATAQAMVVAVDHHDGVSIKKLGAKGVTWSALETHGLPPLANAIVASDVPTVRALLDVGAPTDKMGEEGDTALLSAVAAAAGDSDDALRVVRVLLDHGASPNKRGRDGRTALFAAAQQGSETLVAVFSNEPVDAKALKQAVESNPTQPQLGDAKVISLDFIKAAR